MLSHQTQEMLIIFSRYPLPGKTKTRLAPTLGPEKAAALQKRMTEHIVNIARQCCKGDGRLLEVHYTGAEHEPMRAWLGDLGLSPQGEGTLGDRLARSFTGAFQSGFHKVVIIGSDCPGLTPKIINRAFDLLATSDMVLGPALDGGYYLIGLSRHLPILFHDIPWGTSEVLIQTMKQAQIEGYSHSLLPPLADIDRPEDLHAFPHLS